VNVTAILAELAAATPRLPAARCAGRWELFDATIEAATTGTGGAAELAARRAEALRLCAGCPELDPCQQWLHSLPPKVRPLGVVAGTVIGGRPRPSRKKENPT